MKSFCPSTFILRLNFCCCCCYWYYVCVCVWQNAGFAAFIEAFHFQVQSDILNVACVSCSDSDGKIEWSTIDLPVLGVWCTVSCSILSIWNPMFVSWNQELQVNDVRKSYNIYIYTRPTKSDRKEAKAVFVPIVANIFPFLFLFLLDFFDY